MTKPHLRIEDVEPVRTGRLTNLPSASEVARKRKLAEIGKDLDWYYSQVQASLNEHNEPTCAVCKQPEKKKLPGGQIKMLTIDTRNARLVCDSCANKMYKQQQREKVASRNDRDGAESAEQWWKRNRNKLSEDDRVQYDIREGDVVFLTQALNEHLKGEGWDSEGLRETIRDFCEEVSQHGTLSWAYTFAPEWWKSEDWNKRLSGADALYFQFGYYLAIPDQVAFRFFQFAEHFLGISDTRPCDYRKRITRILAVLDGNEYVDPDLIVTCSTFGCKATKVRGLYEILSPPQWFCPSCEAARMKKAREAASRLNNQRLADQADASRDKWGRERLYGEEPYS